MPAHDVHPATVLLSPVARSPVPEILRRTSNLQATRFCVCKRIFYTAGTTSFPSNQYDLALDYGRAQFDVRNRLFLGGTIGLPYLFRLSPFLVASSGVPFNVTTGVDTNGDSLYTDRPTYAAFQAALAKAQASGTIASGVSFHCQPPAGQTEIPINCGQGPARFSGFPHRLLAPEAPLGAFFRKLPSSCFDCHSERSEESVFAGCTKNRGIL